MKLSCFLRLILSEWHGSISKLITFNGAQKVVKKKQSKTWPIQWSYPWGSCWTILIFSDLQSIQTSNRGHLDIIGCNLAEKDTLYCISFFPTALSFALKSIQLEISWETWCLFLAYPSILHEREEKRITSSMCNVPIPAICQGSKMCLCSSGLTCSFQYLGI